MVASPRLLIIAAFAVLVECRPQEFSFPEESERPSRFPPGPGNGQGMRPPPFRPRPTTRPRPLPNGTSDTMPGSTNNTTPTTRIPPRDPANRIVYIVSCPCQFTPQYSPVCGTDGQTYGNMGVLECAKQCGTKVEVYLAGACGSNNG